METKILNCFISTKEDDKNILKTKVIEIDPIELKALILSDIKHLNIKSSSKEINVEPKEFEKILNIARGKIVESLISGYSIILKEEIETKLKELPNTLCTFRCAICGKVYTVNYEVDEVKCPLCLSSKIMTCEEAGFIKKQHKLINKK